MKKIVWQARAPATRGRPPVESEALNLRLTSDIIEQIDEWRKNQKDIPNRQEAVRRLLKVGIATYSMIKPLRDRLVHSHPSPLERTDIMTTIVAINLMAEAMQEDAEEVAESIGKTAIEVGKAVAKKVEGGPPKYLSGSVLSQNRNKSK